MHVLSRLYGIKNKLKYLLTLGAHAPQGYGNQFVCVSVYLSVTKLTATYIIFKSKVRYHRVLRGILNICNMWLTLKPLY